MSSRIFWPSWADQNKKTCIYLIVYKGEGLPKLYLGKGQVRKMNRGYHGSPCSKEFADRWHETFATSPELFDRFIIETFDTDKQAEEAEGFFLDSLDTANSPHFFPEEVRVRYSI